jgi:type II secretory pathway pseudopilin PulG
MKKTRNSESGLTLIELIISIALIAMILIAFLPMFIMSAETNTKSETTLDSTYLGKDAMEMAYDLSKNKEIIYEDLDNVLVDEKGYSKIKPKFCSWSSCGGLEGEGLCRTTGDRSGCSKPSC